MRRPQPDDLDLDRYDRRSLWRRLTAEFWCFALAFRFHGHNNHLRKAVTIMVVLVWGSLELGNAFGIATVPESMLWLRAFVGLLLGRMWNIEVTQFGALSESRNGDTTDESDDRTADDRRDT